ncbi:MAG: TlyA family rRNA (cytidine-2'-O)-methyltransferase [Myxococcales bacterium]|nr:TlyA family rRNA (cytidine-2'-O)-methyltransferase [Myxococcales bacterium]
MAGPRAARERLDKLMVERGLCETRSRAQALIVAGRVIVDEHAVDKPGTAVAVDAAIRLKGEDHSFVSRGGLKLRGALDAFGDLDVRGRVAMDVGASTGGFTDCLLQAGVARVYAVDVGYGQLAWKIAQDPRVVSIERQNIRTMPREAIPEPVDLVVIDCSFISLTRVLPALPPFLARPADVVALVPAAFASPLAAMAVLMVVLVVIGMVMDPYGAVILVQATLAGIASASGIDPVHFWMVVLVAFELGYLTPPVALNHLLARQVIGDDPALESGALPGSWWRRHERYALPIAVMATTLLLVAFGPLLVGGG